MSFDNIIDIEALVNPISEDAPTGTDIRTDRSPTSDYYTIKDARNNARAAERSSMFDEDVDLITPWRTVVEVAPKILLETSKDLEVASWYTEGLIRLYGFTGLRDGIKLISQLIEHHWQGLYPEPDEDGIETKVAPLTGLNGDGNDGTLLAPMRNAPITDEGDYGKFNLWQYQKARDNDKLNDQDERNSRISALGFSIKDIENTVIATPAEFYVDMVSTLEETLEDYKTLCTQLREHCGNDAPPSSSITTLLDEILRSVRFLSKEKLEALQESQQANHHQNNETPDSEPSVNFSSSELIDQIGQNSAQGSSGPIVHREEALKRLQEVADYFRLHEPHTPIGPGIERLITWGRMTVSELMMELLPEDHSRGLFSQLTGVKLDGSDTGSYVAPPAPVSSNNTSRHTANDPIDAFEPEPVESGESSGW